MYCTGSREFLEGPVNDGYTLGKRKLNFSITGPSCKCFSVNFSTNFLVENLRGRLS
jgi:hypothetical protein